ncbi:MAG: ABC transporter substrate-binding protein [Candidatus Accumulibacter sp.]|jgi:phospholipid transport system substrate-binding protein|nr:ABC transporter substrate-binding protein [Accumulibacter sp.]
MKSLCIKLLLPFFMLLPSVPAFADDLLVFAKESPDALVKRVTDEVLEIVRQDKEIQSGNTKKILELVEAKVFPHFDFDHMTALAVGRDWSRATPEQKKRLADEFHILLVRTYSNALTAYRDQGIRYRALKLAPEDTETLVRTEILQPGSKPIALNYSLEKHDDGWKVFDVAVAGVSLVGNYRDAFSTEVRANGIDGLLKMLVDKNKQLEASQK